MTSREEPAVILANNFDMAKAVQERRLSHIKYTMKTDEQIAEEIRREQATGQLSPQVNTSRPAALPTQLTPEANQLIDEWFNLYRDLFSITPTFSDLVIPPKREGFDWLVINTRWMMPQLVFDTCKSQFQCWKYTGESLDSVIDPDQEERTSQTRSYAIWVRDRIEADEEHKNQSANQVRTLNIKTMTLTERELLELWYYLKAKKENKQKKHLDYSNYTLTCGSRDRGGDVPYVRWYGHLGKLYVYACYPDDVGDYWRSREVVSAEGG